MLNDELMHRPGSKLNDFTRTLREHCLALGTVRVQMRTGDWVDVAYLPACSENHPYDECPAGGFHTLDHSRYWEGNGASITSDIFDLIAFDAPDTAPAMAIAEVDKDALMSEVATALGDAYDCGRVWSAWSQGTMSADDFYRVADDPERVAEIVDAVLTTLANTGVQLVVGKQPTVTPASDPLSGSAG